MPMLYFPREREKGQRSYSVSHAPCYSPTPNHWIQTVRILEKNMSSEGFLILLAFDHRLGEWQQNSHLKKSLRDANRITESPTNCHLLDQVAPGPTQSDSDASLYQRLWPSLSPCSLPHPSPSSLPDLWLNWCYVAGVLLKGLCCVLPRILWPLIRTESNECPVLQE